jgi:hypothetical protein
MLGGTNNKKIVKRHRNGGVHVAYWKRKAKTLGFEQAYRGMGMDMGQIHGFGLKKQNGL